MPHARLVRVHDAAQREDLTPRLRCALGKVRKTVDAFFQVKPTETVMPSSSHHHKLIVALAQLGCSVTLSSSAVHVETNTSAYSEYLNLTGVQKIGACEDNTQSFEGARYWCATSSTAEPSLPVRAAAMRWVMTPASATR